MGFLLLYSFLIFLGLHCFHFSMAKEPMCSKFAYEEQLLEKMIRTEIKVETMVNVIKTTQDNVLITLRDIKQTVADFSDRFEDLRENITEEMQNKGDEITQREELFQKVFKETKANLTSAVNDQRNTIVQLRENLERPSIAFHVHHVTDRNLDTSDEVIIFDKTFLNVGTGYDTSTGIFTAPIGGLYQFVVHTCKNSGYKSTVGLMLESKLIAGNLNYDTDSYTCSMVGAIVRVGSGEKVWVKAINSGSSYVLYEDSKRMNTFSGILVNNLI